MFTFSSIRLSEKFLSFYEEIIDAQHFLFYIILSNYVRSILFCWDKHRDISQPWFHVCMVVHCCKKHVCERKRLSGQPNMSVIKKFLKFKEIIKIFVDAFELPFKFYVTVFLKKLGIKFYIFAHFILIASNFCSHMKVLLNNIIFNITIFGSN